TPGARPAAVPTEPHGPAAHSRRAVGSMVGRDGKERLWGAAGQTSHLRLLARPRRIPSQRPRRPRQLRAHVAFVRRAPTEAPEAKSGAAPFSLDGRPRLPGYSQVGGRASVRGPSGGGEFPARGPVALHRVRGPPHRLRTTAWRAQDSQSGAHGSS